MQTSKFSIPLFVLISFFINACKESSKPAEISKTDSSTTKVATVDTAIEPVYDSTIDPLIVGAAFSKKLKDTLGIRMFEVTMKPGDSMPLHSHPDHAIYLLDTSTSVLYFPGQSKGDTLKDGVPGMGWVMGPFTDAAKNIGKTPVRLLEIDVHRPRRIELPKTPYDSSIDLFTVGTNLQKLADTLGIKMFVATLKPGDTAALHSHPDHAVYVLQGGELEFTFPDGRKQKIKLQKGMGIVNPPSRESVRNIGKTTLKLLLTHIYRAREN